MTDVRVAVVGVGEMGANHARVYAGLKGADLVAVVDADAGRASAVAAQHGCRAASSVSELVGQVDAVSVAVPSSLHAEVACELLDAGIHCLVEKPLASTEADAQAILAAAERGGARLLVGHIERFNPAVEQLQRILRLDHEVLALDARRMSAVSARVTDVDVVVDLMIHDLDIVLGLVDDEVVDIVARGVHGAGRTGGDYVTAVLSFAGGAVASLTASRITQNQVRELQVTTDQRFFTVDYPAQELLIYRQGRIGGVDGADPADGRYVLDVGTERVFVRRTEPLALELAHLLEVARGAEPRISGAHALRALQTAWAIQEQVAGVIDV
jgi:predicted dehydrogenase